MLFPVILFLTTYILMIALPKCRHFTALASALIFIVSGKLPLSDAVRAIDWNVLLMLFGTMGTVYFFIESKMPDKMAEKLLKAAPNAMWVVIILSLFAGIVSAFMDNVATVLMIAPIGLAVAKELKVSPVAMLICIAVSSNLQGAATLVGDTTSIMLGGAARMDFLDFFFLNGKASIFWAVEIGAVATVPVIALIFRKERKPVSAVPCPPVKDYVPSFFLLADIVLLIGASFFPGKPAITNGLICSGIFVLSSIYACIKTHGLSEAKDAFCATDWQTLLLLASLFIVIAGITNAGILDVIASFIVNTGNGNLFVIYTLIVWISVLCSAFIDNIPFVATMLPVVSVVSSQMGCNPTVLYFGLLIGATLGGNITPIGASANIAAIGILRREGYEVKNKDFFKIGVPFTLVAVLCGYIYCWLVWA